MPEHELVYVSGILQRHKRALAKELQRVPPAQRYFYTSHRLNLPLERAQKPSEHRFFLIHPGLLFEGHLTSVRPKEARKAAGWFHPSRFV